MIERLALIGASGHGKVIADIAKAMGVASIVFFDDRWNEMNRLYGYDVIGSVDDAIKNKEKVYDAAIVSIGNAVVRQKIQERLSLVSPALIHPSASISNSVSLGEGSVVMPNAVINADTRVGKGVIVNSGAIVEHDCVIDDFAHICPNTALGGGVHVGRRSWIGIGSSIIQLKRIGDDVTVGAGSIIIRDVPNGQTVVGNPAKLLK